MSLERLKQYAYLLRLHKPIGTLLLLWPTLWALWLAAGGGASVSLAFSFCGRGAGDACGGLHYE